MVRVLSAWFRSINCFFDLMNLTFCKFGGETHAPYADNPSDDYMMESVHVPLFIIIACMYVLTKPHLFFITIEMSSGGRMRCLTKRCEFEYFTSSPQPVYSINKGGKHKNEGDDEMHTTNN